MNIIGKFVKEKRKEAGLTQEEFALRSGLGLRFVRDLEQGKKTVRLDKVNQALAMLVCRLFRERWMMNAAYRKAYVYVREHFAGVLQETDYGYSFKYNDEYLDLDNPSPVSLTLPIRDEEYKSKIMFSFFFN